MTESRKYDTEIAALFVQGFGEAVRAARNVLVSIRRTTHLFPLSPNTLENLDDESLERLDAFRVRYAQLQDLLANKLFRSLLHLEEEKIGSMLDVLNAMEKRGIIVSFEDWKTLRELCNTFMHDYPDQVELRAEALTQAHKKADELCSVLKRIRVFSIDRIGIPSQNLPEVPE